MSETAEILAEINNLFALCNIPASTADEMLAKHEGKEGELLACLRVLAPANEGEEEHETLDLDEVIQEARYAYLLKLASICIDCGISDDEGIQAILDACFEVGDIDEHWEGSVENMRELIKSLAQKQVINTELYHEMACIISGSLNHGVNAIDEATVLSKLENDRNLFNKCNKIVKLCQGIKGGLETAEEKLRDLFDINSIQTVQSIDFLDDKVDKLRPKIENLWTVEKGIIQKEPPECEEKKDEAEDEDFDSNGGNDNGGGGDNYESEDGDMSSDEESTKRKTCAKKKDTTRKRAPDKAEEETTETTLDIEAERRLYESLPIRLKRSDSGMIAADTNVIQLVLLRMYTAMTANVINAEEVKTVVSSLVIILEPLSKVKAHRTIELFAKAKQNESQTITIKSGSTWGSVGISCDELSGSSENGTSSEDSDTQNYMKRVRVAIEEVLPGVKVDEFLGADFKLGGETVNVLSNCINIGIGFVTYSLASLNDILGGLSRGSSVSSDVLLQRAADLAGLTDDKIRIMKVLAYINNHLRPALANDETERAALIVAFDLKHYTTETKAANRKTAILQHVQVAQGTKAIERNVDEGGASEEQEDTDYCCEIQPGNKSKHTARRGRITGITWLFVLLDNIMKRMPEDFMSRDEFIYHLLCAAQTNIYNDCNLELKDFSSNRLSAEVIEKIKKCITKSNSSERGKRSIIIENNDTIDCMKGLLPGNN